MSNRATIQRTVFTDYNDHNQTFGYRMYDDEGQTYCNTMEAEDLNLNDEEFVKKASENFDDMASEIFAFALEKGILVDDNWHTFDLSGEEWKFHD